MEGDRHRAMKLSHVFGAFVTLAAQTFRGEQMDGMSGINVEMCRSLRDVDEL